MSGGRRHRRVVVLSAADEERVARGLLPEDEAEARRRQRVDALTEARAGDDGADGGAGDRANDARLLADVPPHWG